MATTTGAPEAISRKADKAPVETVRASTRPSPASVRSRATSKARRWTGGNRAKISSGTGAYRSANPL